ELVGRGGYPHLWRRVRPTPCLLGSVLAPFLTASRDAAPAHALGIVLWWCFRYRCRSAGHQRSAQDCCRVTACRVACSEPKRTWCQYGSGVRCHVGAVLA